MLTAEEEQRAINLADAASRAASNGLPDLSEKLRQQSMRLMDGLALVPPEFTRHVFTVGGFKDEHGCTLRELYTGTVVYIQRSR